MIAYLLLGIGVVLILVGGLLFLLAAKSGGKAGGAIVLVGVVVLACSVITFIAQAVEDGDKLEKKVERDAWRWVRTTTVTETLLKIHRTRSKDKDCVQSFVLNRKPYTFEVDCSVFSPPYFSQLPKVGDKLQVKFVRPDKSGDKPEVLEVYNLTLEVPAPQPASP